MVHDKAKFDILGRIEYERSLRHWSEYVLAKNSGIAQSTISTWYRNNLKPSLASIEKICQGLGITLSEFFRDDNDMNKLHDLTDDQSEFLNLYASMTDEQRKCLNMLLMSFINP